MGNTAPKTLEEVREWYDRHAPLHHQIYKNAVAQKRMRTIKGILDDLVSEGTRALDVGCGIGHYAVHMADRGASVVGVDISPATIEMAFEHPQVEYHSAAAEEMPNLGRFDLALCTETLEHIHDPQAVVDDLRERADILVASSPINESHGNIGWDIQGHLHVFRTDSFAALFRNPTVTTDGYYCYVVEGTDK